MAHRECLTRKRAVADDGSEQIRLVHCRKKERHAAGFLTQFNRDFITVNVIYADVVLFDTEESWTVDPDKMHSKARNTPFKGITLKGRVKATMLDGKLVYDIR